MNYEELGKKDQSVLLERKNGRTSRLKRLQVAKDHWQVQCCLCHSPLATNHFVTHGLRLTLKSVTGLPSLSVNRRQPDQSTFSLTTLKTMTLTPCLRARLPVLS